MAASPELNPLVYPATLQARQGGQTWSKHLFVNDAGVFHADLNTDETEALTRELSSNSVVGWLRNTDRKPWALCVPYDVDGEDRPMYPDFLVIRSVRSRLVVDIIEPHSISLADAPAKAAGLAKFAAKHADKFGRIELILIDGQSSKRLDLTDETVRNRVRGLKMADELRRLFAEL